MTSRRHSLIEISKIMNTSKSTLNDIKKWKTAVTKSRNDRLKKLTKHDKHHIEPHILYEFKNKSLNFESIIKNLHLDMSENIVKRTLREFEYDHKVAQ